MNWGSVFLEARHPFWRISDNGNQRKATHFRGSLGQTHQFSTTYPAFGSKLPESAQHSNPRRYPAHADLRSLANRIDDSEAVRISTGTNGSLFVLADFTGSPSPEKWTHWVTGGQSKGRDPNQWKSMGGHVILLGRSLSQRKWNSPVRCLGLGH